MVLLTGGILGARKLWGRAKKVIEFEVPVHELSAAGVSASIPIGSLPLTLGAAGLPHAAGWILLASVGDSQQEPP